MRVTSKALIRLVGGCTLRITLSCIGFKFDCFLLLVILSVERNEIRSDAHSVFRRLAALCLPRSHPMGACVVETECLVSFP
jgi:hypothetical protein